MWPPHARTGLATLALNVITMEADLSPRNPVPVEYEYALTAVMVPPYNLKLPGIGVTPPRMPPVITCGSSGIANVENAPQPLTPRQGLAVRTLWLTVVRYCL